ncbi:MAG: serine/threonine-protein kinase [Elusimicrobia bacterium]|nr:serine/threonine-protein kinase [Elusimicrobiota bacterium]
MQTEPDLAGTVFAGCKIISKIGQGGMGSVYKAHHEALDKFVCVKLLSADLARDQRNIEFFLREARSAAKLEHPNIVHVYNFGQENGSYFIIMSYVEGKSLQDLVTEKGPLPVKEATDIMTGVLQGLAHAHSKSVIHRDIKPANILVGTDGVPRIVDFGLARSITEEKQLTMAGEMVGTAYFMSPEQGLAGTVDSRADLYAAGATYFYILSGKYPFDGKSSIEVIHKHIGEPVPNIILLRPDIPLWASRVIERLMRKKPEERYQTAGEVIEEFAKHPDGGEAPSETQEATYEIPELTARISARAVQQPEASLESSQPHSPAPTVRQPAPPPPQPWQQPPAAAPGEKPDARAARPALQMAALHNGLKAAMHFSLTLAGTGCFILAGASGRSAGLAAPLATNPVTAGMLALAGTVLFIWALWQKPLKFTPGYALFLAAAAAAAYAGGAYIPAPAGADTVAKAFLAVRIGLENMFSPANLIVYALFLYIAASKAVFKNWGLKAFAVAAYLCGLALTYFYFKAGAEISPEKVWLAVGGALSLLGVAAALTQRNFSLFFNPQLLFLAANLAMFAMFTNPQVERITDQKFRTEEAAVKKANLRNMMEYQQAMFAAQSEVTYDEEGRPIPPKLPEKPAEVLVTARGKLQNQARLEYYGDLGMRISGTLAGSAGIIFVAFFLALMANVIFVEEMMAAYREQDLF